MAFNAQAARQAGYSDEEIQQYLSSRGQQFNAPQQPAGKSSSFLDLLPVAGGIAGSFVPGLGTIVGSAAGAGLGELARQFITPEDDYSLKGVGKEALLGGAGGVVGKVAGPVLKGAGKLLGRGAGGVEKAAAKSLLKASPSAFVNAGDLGVDLNQAFLKWAPKIGSGADDALGAIGKGAARGTGKIAPELTALENIIGKELGSADDIIIPGKNILARFKNERARLVDSLDVNRLNAVDDAIGVATKKFGNGVKPSRARTIVKNANKNFAKSVVDESKGAAASAGDKAVANALRDELRARFPDVASALDDQQELLLLREVMKKTRGKAETGALRFTKLDLTRPGTFVQAALESPQIGGRIASQAGKGLSLPSPLAGILPTAKSIAGRGAAQVGVRAVGSEQPTVGGAPAPVTGQELSPLAPPTAFPGQPQSQPSAPSGGGISKEQAMALMLQFPDEASTIQRIFEFGQNQGLDLPAEAKNKLTSINTAESLVDQFETNLATIGLGSGGVESRLGGTAKNIQALFGSNAEVAAYNSARKGFASILTKSLGQVGNLSDTDIDRAIDIIPKVTDTQDEARLKLQNIRNVIEKGRAGIMSLGSQTSLPTPDSLF